MDTRAHNRAFWNRQAHDGGEWSRPVSRARIEAARRGRWDIILTPKRAMPRAWLGDPADMMLLCLAGGGGQQAPILAAAGARVISLDLSEGQLALDHGLARAHRLPLVCVQADMTQRLPFLDASFAAIIHPVANVFVPDVLPIWRECYRVLVPGGRLLAGFMNPAYFLFDHDEALETGTLVVRHRLPYAGPDDLDATRRARWHERGEPAEFGHTLGDLIGGQLRAGFHLIDLYEDAWDDEATALNRYMHTTLATCAIKTVASQ